MTDRPASAAPASTTGHPLRLEESASFPRDVQAYIEYAAEHGLYEIRGLGAKRKLPTFDDLVFLTASASRYPLEGYREKCRTETVLGTRYAREPVRLNVPITIAGMSFGALSANVKESLGRAATAIGTSTTTGSGFCSPPTPPPPQAARPKATAIHSNTLRADNLRPLNGTFRVPATITIPVTACPKAVCASDLMRGAQSPAS